MTDSTSIATRVEALLARPAVWRNAIAVVVAMQTALILTHRGVGRRMAGAADRVAVADARRPARQSALRRASGAVVPAAARCRCGGSARLGAGRDHAADRAGDPVAGSHTCSVRAMAAPRACLRCVADVWLDDRGTRHDVGRCRRLPRRGVSPVALELARPRGAATVRFPVRDRVGRVGRTYRLRTTTMLAWRRTVARQQRLGGVDCAARARHSARRCALCRH